MRNKSVVKRIVAIIIGVILYFVLGRYIAISIPGTNEVVSVQSGILAVVSIIYGPLVGVLTGVIGHILIEVSWFGLAIASYAWSSIIASAVFGLLMGLARKTINIRNGRFGARKILNFNIVQIIANGIVWIVIATILNVLIYKQHFGRQLVDGLVIWGANSIITAIVGTILLMIYAKTRRKKGKRRKENRAVHEK